VIESSKPLAGKTALITGVTRRVGIGAAIAHALGNAGAGIFTTYYRPYHADLDAAEPHAILSELRQLSIRAAGVEEDLSDPLAPQRIFDVARGAIGPVDILINNAAFDIPVNLSALTADILDKHYAVNMRGAALMCAEFARRHDGRPGGRIVNLTSGQSLHPMPDELPYAMTKSAIEALTTAASITLGPRGITVNAVDPGGTDTGWMTPDLKQQLAASSVQRRVGLPQDAANLILFLCSPQAQWINGQILRSRGQP
jgi:3-oxoacyl-[acyl-carrier protein] reductase